MVCRDHLTQLRRAEPEWQKRDVQIAIVTFDADFMAKAYVQQTNLEWPLLVDRQRELYRAYGLLHGTWWDIANPVAIWKYLRLMFKGNGLNKPGDDWLQMGGDVLVDPKGIVRMHFVSKTPHDRPTLEEILNVIDQPDG